MAKLWGGRFEKDTSSETDAFNASISFEQRLYPYDILGSIAHVRMLGAQSILSKDSAKEIESGLLRIYKTMEAGEFTFKESLEDIHMNVESGLIDALGFTGKQLHTGRSRNDQVALDMKLYTKDSIIELTNLMLDLLDALNNIAKNHTESIMPGFTHLQQAQPITLAHHFLAYVEKFKRDIKKLIGAYHHMDSMPLGSGALATTSYPIDREMVKEFLGFEHVTENSIDAVSDRDYLVELLSIFSMIAVHMSSLAEEVIIWNSKGFQFITLDDGYSTGSSIMPQKKNPDIAELVRGKSGRIIGGLTGFLMTLKGLPLAYNKDLQEDKEAYFNAFDQLVTMVPIFTQMLATATFNLDNMLQATLEGFTEATDLADYLVKKGIPFRECHHIVGSIVKDATRENKTLNQFSLQEYKAYSELFEEDLFDCLELANIVNSRVHIGGPAFETTKAQTVTNADWMKSQKEHLDSLSSPINILKSIL